MSDSFEVGKKMNQNREDSGCALFTSPLYGNRPVVLIAGGYTHISGGAALLPAPTIFLDFATCMMLSKKSLNNGSFFLCLLFYLVCKQNEIHTINI